MRNRYLTPAIAALALTLAACGAPSEDIAAPAPTNTEQEVPAQDSVDPAADQEIVTMTLDNLTGTAMSGAVFTVRAPEALPAETKAILEDAGIEQAKLDTAQLIPVDIDNQGTEATEVQHLILVNEDGEQQELPSLPSALYEASEELGTGDADRYDRVWESFQDSITEVQPTATGTGYIITYNLPEGAEYTYVAVGASGGEETPVIPTE